MAVRSVNGGLTIEFSIELIQDGISWIAWCRAPEFGISFDFVVEGSNEEERFAYAEKVLRSAKLVVQQ